MSSGCFSVLRLFNRKGSKESVSKLAPPAVQCESKVSPPAYWAFTEPFLPDAVKTVEDTIDGLNDRLRELSMDIHGILSFSSRP